MKRLSIVLHSKNIVSIVYIILILTNEVLLSKLSYFNNYSLIKEIFKAEVSLFKVLTLFQSRNVIISDTLKNYIRLYPMYKVWTRPISKKKNISLSIYSNGEPNSMYKYKLEKISASLGVNTTSKDVSSQIYSGAVLGIILLQNIYELNVDKLAYGQLEYHGDIRLSNFNQRNRSRLTLSDSIIFASRAIRSELYDSALRFLGLAVKMIEVEKNEKWSVASSRLEHTVLDLKYFAMSRISIQHRDISFKRNSKMLLFSTPR